MKTRKLSDLNLVGGSDAAMNVCLVSSEFLGPVKNGGIGTATSGLARQLVADGHKVTLLYTLVEQGKPVSGDLPWQHWVDTLLADGIVLKHIPHDGDYMSWRAKSWHVRDFIAQGNFDLVYFNDHHGSGYYSIAAKRARLEPFSDQLHCVITHGSMEWVFDINEQYAVDPTDLEMMGLERRSVEWADVVIGPSSYLLGQYERYGWQLPEQTFQQFYPLFDIPPAPMSSERIAINELVFFGRLETRKGLWLFCDALDLLGKRLEGQTVSFLGRMMDTAGISSGIQVINRTHKWPCRVKMLTDYDGAEARAYLRKPGRLAVMPSLADNSPCVVYECMHDNVPFVGTLGNGTEELIHPDCWDETMTAPNAAALSERLADILDRGARLSRPGYDPRGNLATWSAWHRYLSHHRTEFITTKSLLPLAASTATVTSNTTDHKQPLMVIIDRGTCSISLMVANLTSHIKRFGKRVACLLVTSREGELQDILFDLFGGASAASPVAVASPHALDDARELMLAASVVFFLDVEVEIAASFFMLALRLLMQHEAKAVSCVVAVKSTESEELKIEELPSGDVPALGALGESIGSAAWAVSSEVLSGDLATLPFYDAQMDELASAATLGQILLYRHHLANRDYVFLPMIGATITRERGAEAEPMGQYSQITRAAAALGIAPSVYGGGAPWFAMSRFINGSRRTTWGQRINGLNLPPEHPLTTAENEDRSTDLAQLAAALSRPELVLQIEASSGAPAERVRQQTEVMLNSIRLRPSNDLGALLRAGPVIGFGSAAVPEPIAVSKRPAGRERSVDMSDHKSLGGRASAQVYLDATRLRVQGNRVYTISDLTETVGKLLFADVPLCGNAYLWTKIRCVAVGLANVQVKVLDQANGALMGSTARRIDRDQEMEFSIPLHGVYSWVAVQLEFRAPIHTELVIDACRID